MTVAKTFYVTTPIYYPSGKLHIGNTYTTVLCDALKRYKAMRGYDTFYLTGMDEHGKKIETVAAERGLTASEHVDGLAEETRALWDRLNIGYDDFIRTTEKRHKSVVQKNFETLLEKGDIYLGTYRGNYCMPCESFYTDAQLNEEGACPDCGRKTTALEEESYFFKLQKYEKRLLDFIEANPDFITPETRKNEVVAFIERGLNDLSVSRTTFDWGIKVVSNPKHVVYVWIDALTNYISALGYGTEADGNYDKYWLGDEVLHVVGKDILRFHAVYWPALLMALDIPVTFKLHAHGFYMMKDGKMSKSKGAVIYPDAVLKRYGLDEVRYFLLREIPYGGDGVFTPEAFIERINYDLANDFGNLLNRTLTMINKYFGGSVKPTGASTSHDEDLVSTIASVKDGYVLNMDALKLSQALAEIWRLISRSNKYIDETTPWMLAKDEEKKDTLENVLYHLAESLRTIGVLLRPVLLEAAPSLFAQLGVPQHLQTFESLTFGAAKNYTVVKEPVPMFPRLDVDAEVEALRAIIAGVEKETVEREAVSIDDFDKLELRVGLVVDCEPHPNADKLLVVDVDIGHRTMRVVAGIAKQVSPKTLKGKKVVVLTNLEATKLRGVTSEGMLLAGSNEDTLEVVTVKDLRPGDIVK